MATGYHTKATIAEIEAIRRPKTGMNYYPILHFKTLAGEHVQQRAKFPGKKESTYTKGAQVEIYYNPSRPKDFIIVNDVAYNGMGIVKIVGLIFTFIGTAGIIYCFIKTS